ncbi:histone acetyltransferase [Favolaschia claudopus]|uniref:Histone acetyltransferase n=1 Tax=Favolaschia claudopus TaxID=2862362 RepID=A0AAW0A483_9AGAR
MEYATGNLGDYVFPPPEYLLPNYVPYDPYYDLPTLPNPSATLNDAPGAPDSSDDVSTPPAALNDTSTPSVSQPAASRKRAGSDSVVSSTPVKRRPGRPRGSKSKANTAATKKGGKAASKSSTANTDNQENIPPEPIDILDSEDEMNVTADGKIKRWTPEERTQAYEFILGADENGNKRFGQLQKNPSHVYKRTSEMVFEGVRSPDSVKSMYVRSLETFGWIRVFNSFTGNGAGDADCDGDPMAILKARLTDVRGAGLAIGSLKPATIAQWEEKGWYDLFQYRYGGSSKITRKVARNSASALSDREEEVSSEEADTKDVKPAGRVPKTPVSTVSEPKHTPASGFRKQVGSSLNSLGEFMKVKLVSEEKKAGVLDAKLKLEREKFEVDKMRGKVEMAHQVLNSAGASDEVRNAANAFLLGLFST